MKYLFHLIALILVPASSFGADAFNSPHCRRVRNSTASITVAFDYAKTSKVFWKPLENTPNDGRFFHNRIGKAFAPARRTLITDQNVTKGKEDFLRQLRESAGTAEYINLNFSGHGTLDATTGEWKMPLPNIPRDLAERCIGLSQKDDDCHLVDDYYVTVSDIESAFKGKKIFGVFDACHSGRIKFKNGVAINASSHDQTASDKNVDSVPQGTLTTVLQKLLEGCATVANPERVTLTDILAYFSETGATDPVSQRALIANYQKTIGQYNDQVFNSTRGGQTLLDEHCLQFSDLQNINSPPNCSNLKRAQPAPNSLINTSLPHSKDIRPREGDAAGDPNGIDK